MIKLIVDSTCDLPTPLIHKYGIAVLPLQVTIGEKSYRDGFDIHVEQLYQAMRSGIVPKTSQINIAEAEALFRSTCKAGNDFIYLCFSSGMSGTYQTAKMIVDGLHKEYPDTKMEVIDSEGGGLAVGLTALQTARWICVGKEFHTITSLIKDMISRVQHLFTVDSLQWLVKGGRLPRSAGYVGDKLHIKPILNVVNKTIHVMRITRGKQNAMRTLVQLFLERTKNFPSQLIGIQHADDPETAERIAQMISKANPQAKTIILPIGCVLGTHIGIGGVGLFFFKEPVKGYDLLLETS